MGNRISRDELHQGILELMEKRGTCGRLKVAALIVMDNRVIATGYNGTPSGLPHCGEYWGCDPSKPCTAAIHAEANAIYFCAKHGISTLDSTIITSASPCIKCAEAIIQAGISCVIYRDEFRDTSGIELLIKAGIKVKKYDNKDAIQNS